MDRLDRETLANFVWPEPGIEYEEILYINLNPIMGRIYADIVTKSVTIFILKSSRSAWSYFCQLLSSRVLELKTGVNWGRAF